MQCASCRFDNLEGMKFCTECGAPLRARCSRCGFESPPRAKFCGECGSPLAGRVPSSKFQVPSQDSELRTPNLELSPVSYTPPHLAERIRAEQAALEARGAADGERKTITVLFADLKGSTALIEGLDPEEARAIIDPALQLMMDAVHRYDGYVAQVLFGRWVFYTVQGNHTAARALGEQFLPVTQRQQDTTLSLVVHTVLGSTSHLLGEFAPAQAHLEQAFAFYDPEHHRDLGYHMGHDPGLMALEFAAQALWCRGYPDQALERARHGLSVAQALSHPLSLAMTLGHVALVHLLRRKGQEAHAQAEALLTLAHEHGFAQWLAFGMGLQGSALVERAAQSGAREQREAGRVQLREGLATMRATEGEVWVPLLLGALAQGYAQGGQAQEGLKMVAEALAVVEKNEERWNEAELYRLKGELTLQQESQKSKGKRQKAKVPNPKSQILNPNAQGEAEVCFLKAIEIAQKQQAKSLELRAVMSLVRLRQQQATQPVSRTTLAEAHQMLSEIYHWFTEGFDTKDLKEAKALLEELG